jgi:glucokinase
MATVGIDLGGTKCLGVAVAGGEVVSDDVVPTPDTRHLVLDAMAELVRTLAAKAGEPLTGVGVGVPGLVDGDGVLRFAPNLQSCTGLAVRQEMEARLGVPVEADNDATCAAWGEREMGVAKGLDEVVLVTLGTGIGGGIVSRGQIQRGANRFAGEVGHMVVDPAGPPCPCGRKGCWERFASGSALGRLAREAARAGRATRIVDLAGGDVEMVKGEHVSAALAEGDAEAAEILGEFAWWVALGLANLANVFDPEAFVIGGGLVKAGSALFEEARQAFDRMITGQAYRPVVPILPAALGSQAGAIGAACLAARELPITSARVGGDER